MLNLPKYTKPITYNEWTATLNRGVWTYDDLCGENGFVSPELIGRHWIRTSGGDILLEGINFVIVPTSDEIEYLVDEMLRNIDKQKVRGFHPWQFSGSCVIDDQTLIVATTKENGGYCVEARFFTNDAPRWSKQISDISRSCKGNKKALVECVEKLFERMARCPKF